MQTTTQSSVIHIKKYYKPMGFSKYKDRSSSGDELRDERVYKIRAKIEGKDRSKTEISKYFERYCK